MSNGTLKIMSNGTLKVLEISKPKLQQEHSLKSQSIEAGVKVTLKSE